VRGALRSVLLLGFGGGTVARQMRAMFPRVAITGVEIDGRIAALAKSHFASDDIDAKIVVGSGEEFLRRSRRRFDFILDDMWDHEQRRRRAVAADPAWPEVAVRHLTRRLYRRRRCAR